MTSKVVIHRESAMPWNIKRSTLVSEVFRRLYNCDTLVNWEDRTKVVNELVVKMSRSGYRSPDIKCFVKGGVNRYEKLLTRVREADRPLYRDDSFQKVERWRKKVTNKSTWSKAKSVVFIPLSQKLKEEATAGVNRIREDIKVVERGGTTLKNILQKSDPARNPLCRDVECWICGCEIGGQKGCVKGGCSLRNVGYVITCIDYQNRGLDRRYEGETGGEARRRGCTTPAGLESQENDFGAVQACCRRTWRCCT